MNPFGIAVAVLQFAAGLYAAWGRDWPMAVVWICFSIAGAILASR